MGPLFKLLCLLALLVALTAGVTVFFRVEVVAVTGNQRYTQEEIVEVSGIRTGDNLYGWNKFQVAQRLRQQLPYIGEVTIRRSLPSTVVITVDEWSAVAKILPPDADQTAQLRHELEEASGTDQPEELEDSSQAGSPPELDTVTDEPWLISVKGKLLEPAAGDSGGIMVTGLAALLPQAGTALAVPQVQQARLDALLKFLEAAEAAGMTGDFSMAILGRTRMELRYLERFTVKVELSADFPYELQVLQAVREDVDRKHGPQAGGSIDLTQAEHEAVLALE